MDRLMYLDKNGELLPKSKRFCEYYFKGDGSVGECMVKAEFSMSQAKRYGRVILTYPEIKAYLANLESQVQKEVVASKEEVLTFWTELMTCPYEKTSDRLNASKLLAQYLHMMDTGDKGDDKPIIVFDIKPDSVNGDVGRSKPSQKGSPMSLTSPPQSSSEVD